MVSFTCLAYTSTDFDTGVHRNFSRGETSAFCLCFSSCSRCNKNGLHKTLYCFYPQWWSLETWSRDTHFCESRSRTVVLNLGWIYPWGQISSSMGVNLLNQNHKIAANVKFYKSF